MLNCELRLQRDDFELEFSAQIPLSGVTAVCGPSGSGKTSLLRCIAGLEKHATGRLQFRDNTWQEDGSFTAPEKRGIAYVFQDARLLPHLSVQDNLRFAYRRRFQNHGPDIASVAAWTHIESLLSRSIEKLSGGEQKRVAIARCLLQAPQLILMDEPLTGLHDEARLEMLALLADLPGHTQAPMIYVSHSFPEVSRLADHAILLENGRISARGSVMALSQDLQSPLSHRDNAASILNASIAEHDADYGLSFARIGNGCGLWLPLQQLPIGTEVRLQLPARDISLTLEAPETSSILNILPCRVESIEDSRSAHVLLQLGIAGQTLLARITRKSLDRLRLQTGQQLFAQIKTASLLSERVGVSSHE